MDSLLRSNHTVTVMVDLSPISMQTLLPMIGLSLWNLQKVVLGSFPGPLSEGSRDSIQALEASFAWNIGLRSKPYCYSNGWPKSTIHANLASNDWIEFLEPSESGPGKLGTTFWRFHHEAGANFDGFLLRRISVKYGWPFQYYANHSSNDWIESLEPSERSMGSWGPASLFPSWSWSQAFDGFLLKANYC